MKQFGLIAGAMLALSACSPPVPDSGAGVGFGDYAEYELERARREAQLQGRTTGFDDPAAVSSSDLAAAGIGQTGVTTPTRTGSEQAVAFGRDGFVEASPQNAAPTQVNNPGISDEQDFAAVSERETIESDAARRAQQQAQYQVVTAGAAPTRSGSTGPNIVSYALQTSNAKGQSIYSRMGLSGQARFQRNCAKYRSPDEAQRDFLARGGPERDRMGIDPDGDGFACGWDPSPFRLAGATQLTPAAPATDLSN